MADSELDRGKIEKVNEILPEGVNGMQEHALRITYLPGSLANRCSLIGGVKDGEHA